MIAHLVEYFISLFDFIDGEYKSSIQLAIIFSRIYLLKYRCFKSTSNC